MSFLSTTFPKNRVEKDNKGKVSVVIEDQEEPQVKLYNHLEIFNEYKEYCKNKKSFERDSFDIWLVQTYPNMLYIKRDNI